MDSKRKEKNLKEALNRLETSAQKIVGTRGYTDEVAKVRTLAELIKEQFKNENTRHSAG